VAILYVVRQWRENFAQTIKVQAEASIINIYVIISIIVLCPRIIAHSIMNIIKHRPKWVGEAVSSFHDSRRKKTFYRQVCMLIIIFILINCVLVYIIFISHSSTSQNCQCLKYILLDLFRTDIIIFYRHVLACSKLRKL
jgi:hypothetical protein